MLEVLPAEGLAPMASMNQIAQQYAFTVEWLRREPVSRLRLRIFETVQYRKFYMVQKGVVPYLYVTLIGFSIMKSRADSYPQKPR